MSQNLTGFGYYAQNIQLPLSATVASTGLVAATRVHFSQPIDILKIMVLQNGTALNINTAVRWKSVSVYGGSTVVRTSEQLVIPATLGAGSGVGHFTELTTPLRVDPGEEAVMDVVVNTAAQTVFAGFLYRAYGFHDQLFAFNQYGVAPPEDRMTNVTEVIAT